MWKGRFPKKTGPPRLSIRKVFYVQIIAKVLSTVARLALWLAGIGLVTMTSLVAWQVWARYVLNASPSWTEPTSILLMGWFIFLGAAVGVREGYHLGFDILLTVVSCRVRKLLQTVSDVLVMIFGIGMSWYGWTLTAGTWSDIMPALQLPGGITYLPLLMGGFLMAIFSLERIVCRFADSEDADHDNDFIEEAV